LIEIGMPSHVSPSEKRPFLCRMRSLNSSGRSHLASPSHFQFSSLLIDFEKAEIGMGLGHSGWRVPSQRSLVEDRQLNRFVLF
jgi:hypothetical protein